MSSPSSASSHRLRIRVFVDFWNFSLSLNTGFRTDWQKVGPLLAREAGALVDATAIATYEAMHVYGSFDPLKPADVKLQNWVSNWLDKQPGMHVEFVERQRKIGFPKCPHCQKEVQACPSCGHDMRGTEEKGVDTRIVTDMISLAWSNAYDVAVLVSADRDFVPVAEFLQTKGIKVIHGAFPPKGHFLSQKCWAQIDIRALKPQFARV